MTWHWSEWELETTRLRVVGWQRRADDVLVAFLTTALTEEVILPKSATPSKLAHRD